MVAGQLAADPARRNGETVMTKTQLMRKLKAAGTAQTRKILGRHGVQGDLYGVPHSEFAKLKRTVRVDHDLAEELWATGNFDARYLATMIADPASMTSQRLNAWVKDLDCYPITDGFAALAVQSRAAESCMKRWTVAKGEWVGQAGWWLLSNFARNDDRYPDSYFVEYLKAIESRIHGSKNRVRHSMNGVLISIGIRNARLRKKALDAARRIGKVDVDHGKTACKTPEAVAAIQKEWRKR